MARSDSEQQYMSRALDLARGGIGRVSPNPLVGCVIVAPDGEILGEGAHLEFGGPHAEVLAVRDAESKGKSVNGATVYLTLEPHSFHGKTPPCTDLLISKQIAKCVIAMEDPNPRVTGEGIRQLQANGIEVTVGIMDREALELNRFFIKQVTTGIPYVTLKLAMSIDGRSALANGQSKWITSEASRRRVHAMRAEHDAVMVGMRTALLDDPELTVRYGEVARQPWRVVLDPLKELPKTIKLFTDAHKERTIVITKGDSSHDEVNKIGVAATDGMLDLREALARLGARGIASVLVEAGPTLAASIVKKNLFDELIVFQAPIVLGGDTRPAIGDLTIESLVDAQRLLTYSIEAVEKSGDIQIRLRRSGTEQS